MSLTRACNAAPMDCAAAIFPIHSKQRLRTIYRSWASRCAKQRARWAPRNTALRKHRSTTRWTIWRGCAISSTIWVGGIRKQGKDRTASKGSRDKGTARASSIRPASSIGTAKVDNKAANRTDKLDNKVNRGKADNKASRVSKAAGRAAVEQGNAQAGGGQIGDRLAGQAGNPGQVGNAVGGGGGGRYNGYGGVDTGNTRISGTAVAPQRGPNPADSQREIAQGLDLLNQVKGAVQDSPEARQELQSLIEQMRKLDPSRFPGNPALTEQMHQQLVSEVDALELQLRRQLDETRGGTIRNTDPTKIPAGYQDSVAEYYRKLSGGGTH